MLKMNADSKQYYNSMTAAELLIHCLRELPVHIQADMDWQELLQLAEKHGVLPLIHRELVKNNVQVSGFFFQAVHESNIATESLVAELENLLTGFAQPDIVVMPLKGPVLAEMLYGNASIRPSTDLDLLVRHCDFQRAEKMLTDTGWTARGPADRYHQGFLRNDVLLELHFDITPPGPFSLDVDEIWNRSATKSFHGCPIRSMSEEDQLLYLCIHGLKHGFYRLIWCTDILRALIVMPPSRLQSVYALACRQGLELALFIACEMVQEVFPQQLPANVVFMMSESPEIVQKARASVRRLLAGGQQTSIGPEIWSLYLQGEKDLSMRWRRRLKSFTPTREDYLWAYKKRIDYRLIPVLRPFRLLAKHGPRRIWRNMFPPISR